MAANKLFHDWVNDKFNLFILLLLLIPLSLSSGVMNTGTIYMVGSLSAIPADITMASYALTIGMVCGIPLVLAIKDYYSSKEILIVVFIGLMMVNFVISHTDQPLILVMSSFVNGFFKIIGLLEILGALLPILMPNGERHRLYAAYYPVNLISTQFTAVAFVWATNAYNWQISQMYLNIPLALGLVLVIIFIHPEFLKNYESLVKFDWLGLVFSVIFMLLLGYVLTYGQVKDWFASREIGISSIFCLIALLIALGRTFVVKKPFLDLSLFKYRNVVFGLFIVLVLSAFYGAGGLINNLTSIVLKNNAVENARISLYLIPGYLVAVIGGYWYYSWRNDFKVIIIVVGLCYTISFVLLYFLTTVQATSADFYLPMFFRGAAILLSFMAAGIYISNGVPFDHFFSNVFYYLTVRIFLGPVIIASFFSNYFYRRTIANVNLLASKIDVANSYQQARYPAFVANAIKSGQSRSDAANTAVRNMYGAIQTQASLLAIKEALGILIIIGILLVTGLFIAKMYRSEKVEQVPGFVMP